MMFFLIFIRFAIMAQICKCIAHTSGTTEVSLFGTVDVRYPDRGASVDPFEFPAGTPFTRFQTDIDVLLCIVGCFMDIVGP